MAKAFNKEVFESMPVPKAVTEFVVPAMLSTIITIIYSLADTFFVGLIGDPNQIAAMSVAFPVYQFLNAFGSLFGLGTNSSMARSLGEKKFERVSRASALGLWAGVVFIAVMCVVLASVMRPLLHAVGATSNTYDFARAYLKWTFVIGGIPTVASIVLCNQLRAEGQAKKASFGLMLGGILNCLFDPLFIFVFHNAVVGAAQATALCNTISLCYFLCVCAKRKNDSYICLNPFKYRVDGALLREIVLVGLPSCCLTVLGATGCFVQNHLLSRYSDEAVAAFGIVTKVAFIGINCTHGVAQGVLPLIGYNFGAKKFERVRAVNRCAIRILLCIAVVLLALCELFPRVFIRVFINDAATIALGAPMLRLYMLCMPFMSIILLTSTLCQAVGKWKHALAMLAFRQLVFNIPFMILLDRFVVPMYGVPLGQPCCDVLCLFIAIGVYRSVFVRAMQKQQTE